MEFVIVKTNIVNVAADAVVLPANPMLREGSGASAAIFEAAGRKQLAKACSEFGKIAVGSAVPTLAYDLNAKYIIHAVVPIWIDGKHNEYDLLSSAYLSALNVADVMGCSSIAFPLLASGNNGYDLELAFRIAKESINSFQGVSVAKVILVIYGNRIASIVESLGYNVNVIPEGIRKEEQKFAHKAKMKKLAAEGKEIAEMFLENQLQKGLDYLKDEKNQEKLIELGINIVKKVLNANKDSE
ncbi:MAG: macro domain-containing protein [Solobacterium sp.]|nr:macro domain-containing protein [Solobacterium sp.]